MMGQCGSGNERSIHFIQHMDLTIIFCWLVSVCLGFLPSSNCCPLLLFFWCSSQHQGRLSLDLSHKHSNDYSENSRTRASHGSNSLPSSARLGNQIFWFISCEIPVYWRKLWMENFKYPCYRIVMVGKA